MKIDALNRPLAAETSVNESRAKDKPEGQSSGAVRPEESVKGDVVQLSDRSRLIARAQELAGSAPEVREAKINDLRDRIQAGTYNVNGQTVAESMLRKSITEV
jgi:negative regulator of flagellin synthesis FlgM